MMHTEALKLITARVAMNTRNITMYHGKQEPYPGYLDYLKAYDADLRATLAVLQSAGKQSSEEAANAD